MKGEFEDYDNHTVSLNRLTCRRSDLRKCRFPRRFNGQYGTVAKPVPVTI